MNLPPELRLLIYQHAVDVGIKPLGMYPGFPGCFYPGVVTKPYWLEERFPRTYPNILTASSQVRKEVLPVFYQAHRFIFELCSMRRVLEWVLMVGRSVELKYLHAVSCPERSYNTNKGKDKVYMALYLLSQLHGFHVEFADASGEWHPFRDQLEELVDKQIAGMSLTSKGVEGRGAQELVDMVRPWWVNPRIKEEYESEMGE